MKRWSYTVFFLALLLPALLSRAAEEGLHRLSWWSESRVCLDSAGVDYGFDGLYRERPGGVVFHAAQLPVSLRDGLTPRIVDVEYLPVSFSFDAIPTWAIDPPAPSVSLQSARGDGFLSVRIPAFRSVGNRLERLVSYRVEWSSAKVRTGQNVTELDFLGAPHSRLAGGLWVKIAVSNSGIYKISYEQLVELGLGNPAMLSVWGHDGRQLPYMNDVPCVDDLRQLPLHWHTQSPGVVQPGDYALVYLGGVKWWAYDSVRRMFIEHTHEYSERSHYFITTSEVPEMVREGACSGGDHTQSHFWALAGYRGREVNLAHSGREWFGDSFSIRPEWVVGSGFTEHAAGAEAKVWIRLAASSMRSSAFDFSVGELSVGRLRMPAIPLAESRIRYATVRDTLLHLSSIPAGEFKLGLKFSKPTPSSNGWLSRLAFNVRQPLRWSGSALAFYSDSVGLFGETLQLSIADLPSNLELWDVTNPFRTVRYTQPERATLPAGQRNLLVLFNPATVQEVEVVGRVENQNLHAMRTPDLLIVTHGRFRSQAEQIAQIYRTSPLTRLDVAVVDVEEVYNEFSSGSRDVSAIRNLARMLYWRGGGPNGKFRYLLLFGKPLYAMKDYQEMENLVPNYQSLCSWDKAESFGTDDFFGLLDLGEGAELGLMDIGIGRYSVWQPDYADLIVRHEQAYHNPKNWGGWLREGVIVADDEDRNSFMRDADSLVRYMHRERPEMLIRPLYADAYKQENRWYRGEYPSLTAAISARANQGISFFNYIGHANPNQLGHEYLVHTDNVADWRNLNHLPLFVAASCNLAEYDFREEYSLAEQLLCMPQGGAIGVISTTRVAFSQSNFNFNSNLVQSVYPPSSAPSPRALGDALRRAKARTTGVNNKRKFVLLGNPALPLLNPEAEAEITAIRGHSPQGLADTVRARETMSLDVSLTTADGLPFSGEVFVTVLGPRQRIKTKGNDAEPPFSYYDRTTTLFRGSATAKEGQARVEFIVPTDMDLEYGTGLISLLGVSSEGLCAGSYENFVVGGVGEGEVEDKEGPEIMLSLNDYAHRPNAVVDPNPVLIVRLRDSSGINVSGGGRGHDLRFVLRGGGEHVEASLNDFYQAQRDTYRAGEARYQFNRLDPGRYSLTVEAWDVCNNSSSAQIEFTVVEARKPQVSNLLNYPNPFTERTAFYFDGTRPGQATDVVIQIFTVDGQLVKSIRAFEPSPGLRFGPYEWDGRDDWGRPLGRGVYFYRVKLRHMGDWLQEEGVAERFEKLLKL